MISRPSSRVLSRTIDAARREEHLVGEDIGRRTHIIGNARTSPSPLLPPLSLTRSPPTSSSSRPTARMEEAAVARWHTEDVVVDGRRRIASTACLVRDDQPHRGATIPDAEK
jgi:hypothetical protein